MKHAIAVDDSVHPYRVCVDRKVAREQGPSATLMEVLEEYCRLMKLVAPPCILKTYGHLLWSESELIERFLKIRPTIPMPGTYITLVLRPIVSDPNGLIFGAAVDTVKGRKVIFVNSSAPAGRAYVTAFHELLHVAEYMCKMRMDHHHLHLLSCAVASEIVPLIHSLRKEVFT